MGWWSSASILEPYLLSNGGIAVSFCNGWRSLFLCVMVIRLCVGDADDAGE